MSRRVTVTYHDGFFVVRAYDANGLIVLTRSFFSEFSANNYADYLYETWV